jgi:hypothetical protein
VGLEKLLVDIRATPVNTYDDEGRWRRWRNHPWI